MISSKKYKKIAFSLAESLISMMILTLTIMLTMSSLTKKKSHVDKEVISPTSGMYLCWKKGTMQEEWKCTGNNCSDITPAHPTACNLKFDRRIKKYYIIATGARYCEDTTQNKCTNGQIKFIEYTPAADFSNDVSEFKIILGESKVGDDGNTKIMGVIPSPPDDKVIDEAIGGIAKIVKDAGGTITANNKSGLLSWGGADDKNNIDNCKFISPVNFCGSNITPECKVLGDSSPLSRIPNIGIYCGGSSPKCNLTNLEQVTTYKDTYESTCEKEEGIGSLGFGSVKIKVKQADSSLNVKEYSKAKDSEFYKQLRMLPTYMRNAVLNRFMQQYYSGDIKDGAVIIIW